MRSWAGGGAPCSQRKTGTSPAARSVRRVWDHAWVLPPYQVKYKLYELEEILPGHFMRVSKSTILNLQKIYALHKTISSPCLVEFANTSKQVYVSRHYYRPLRSRLEEKRL